MNHIDGEPTHCVHGVKLDTEYCGDCFRSGLTAMQCKHGFTERKFCPICSGEEAKARISRKLTDEECINIPFGQEPLSDEVHRPAHYANAEVECIDAMRSAFGQEALENYCVIAAFKYLWRADKKGNRRQDLLKAIWYLRYATGDDPRKKGATP